MTATKSYYFGSLPAELERSRQLQKNLREVIARRKATFKEAKIISGAFLLLNLKKEIIGFCPLAACLFLRPKESWSDFDFYSVIGEKLKLSRSEIEDFVLGFDGEVGDQITTWYLLGAEMREELQPESNFEIMEM